MKPVGVWRVFLALLPLLALAGSSTTTTPDCEMSYCATLRPDECYLNSEYCCQTCDKYRTGRQDCEFGDRASICREELCVIEENWIVCCGTCHQGAENTTASLGGSTTVSYVTTAASGDSTVHYTYSLPDVTSTFTDAVTIVTTETTTESFSSAGTDTTTPPSDCQDGTVGGQSCREYVEQTGAHTCYTLNETCCRTCASVKDVGNTDCPYGDRDLWCEGLESQKCHHQEETCCGTCADVRQQINKKDCLYGDRAPRFCRTLVARECYAHQDICCLTCSNLALAYTHLDNCTYGDMLEKKLCERYTTPSCTDNTQMMEQCCETCSGRT